MDPIFSAIYIQLMGMVSALIMIKAAEFSVKKRAFTIYFTDDNDELGK